jgi:CDP-glycerol glycerophosphotransferase (TagB/SpsB family)
MKSLFNKLFISAWLIAIRQTITALMARASAFFLTHLIKRDQNLIMVAHRPGSSFSDNSKYFFVYATQMADKNDRIVMLTTEPGIKKEIDAAGGLCALHPSLQSLYLLLRCCKMVTDMDWFNFSSYPLTTGAKLIQLWHGAPLKHIELDLYRKRLKGLPAWKQFFIKSQKIIIGRYPVYDLVLSTSRWFIDNAFKKCFKAKQFISAGYPRNDILFGWPKADTTAFKLAWINVDKKSIKTVSEARLKNQKICLYVPTFRNDLTNPFNKFINLDRLSDFAQKKTLLIVLKLHPFMHGYADIDQYPNILEYPALCDVYPLMPLCDLLVTDYSSIFFDFLLLDRPVVFYAYDLADYLKHDRSMYFEYEKMTPGAHCQTQVELESHLQSILDNECRDEYAEMRNKIRRLSHDHTDNQASRRLFFDYLKKI